MKIFWSYIKEIFGLARGKIILNLSLMVVLGTIEGIGILLLIPLLHFAGIGEMPPGTQEIQAAGNIFSHMIPALSLPVVLIIYTGLIFMQSGLHRYQSNLSVQIQQSFHSFLSVRLFQGLAYAKWSFLASRKKSDFTTLFFSELGRVTGGTQFLFQLAATVIVSMIQIGIVFLLSPILTLVVIGGGLLFFIFMQSYVRQVK
ncbi:MAG: hypothetical protein PHZ11_08310 [Desulfitobacteriaceae bacterium]|nr:hypothetical protein [Desulfitobacteriaceae bacterium]MDD4346869.1 hypothetical protein [Desulfitobacteriaceae bacterium]MDD4402362.1 hypothetical protein [Desulfitobacteriaceae bacterium]